MSRTVNTKGVNGCDHCGKPLYRYVFCSDKHKNAFHNALKSENNTKGVKETFVPVEDDGTTEKMEHPSRPRMRNTSYIDKHGEFVRQYAPVGNTSE